MLPSAWADWVLPLAVQAWSAAASGASAAAGGAFGSMGFGDDIDFGSTGGSGMPGGMEWVDKGDIIEMDSD